MSPSPPRGLLIAACLLLAAILAGTAWNAVTLRRLRAELAAQQGQPGASGQTHAASSAPSAGAAPSRAEVTPGLPSSVIATGWHGRRAAVLHVEGAVPDAPLRPEDKPRPQGDWLVMRRASPPATLNPIAGADGEAAVLTAPIVGRLLVVDPDDPAALAPSLATSWDVSADGLSCTFHLRRGVQFADGRPFTSADVAFSFAVVWDPAVHAGPARRALADVASLSTPDAFTVVTTYRERSWRSTAAIATGLRVLNAAWYAEQMPAWAARLGLKTCATTPGEPGFADVFNAMRIPCPGTGPYYFEGDDLAPGPVSLVRNPFSWAMQAQPERHAFEGLRWIAVADDAAALELVRRGELDTLAIDPWDWDAGLATDAALAAVASFHAYDHAALPALAIAWNARRPPLDDARVRRALTLAIDRDAIVREVLKGRGTVPACPGKTGDPQAPADQAAWPHDEAAARRLLADAGLLDAGGDGRVEWDGKPVALTLAVGSSRPLHAEIARRVAAAGASVGVGITVSAIDAATLRRRLDERDFDAALIEAQRSPPWDPHDDFHSSQDAPGGHNVAGFRDAAADAALDALRAELDPVARREKASAFQAVFHEQQPWTMLVEPQVGVLVHRRIEGVTLRPTGIQTFDLSVPAERQLRR